MPVAMISHFAMQHKADAPYVHLLREAGFEVTFPEDPEFSRGRGEEETIRVLGGASAVIAGLDNMTRRVIESLPKLRVIARGGVGFDRVDVEAATRQHVAVTITPESIQEAVAEHTLALLLAVSRHIPLQDRVVRSGTWEVPMSRSLRGATLGLFGLGRIGRSAALRAKAFRMTLIAFDPYADAAFACDHGIKLVNFNDLLERSDFISLHSPLTDQTRRLFDRRAFDRMKAGCVLINTARGDLVVEADLVKALESGQIGGAGLDVFPTEPIKADNPLLKFDQVVLTPHKSAHDMLSRQEMGIEAAQCIVDLYQSRWPGGCVVNDELKANWRW